MLPLVLKDQVQKLEQGQASLAAAVEEIGVNTVALAMALLDHQLITEAQLEVYKTRAAEAIKQALAAGSVT